MYVENVRGQSSIYLQKVGVTIVDYPISSEIDLILPNNNKLEMKIHKPVTCTNITKIRLTRDNKYQKKKN